MNDYKVVIENPKGSYKTFVDEDSPSECKDYPLKGVTYPVDYGYIEGYIGEDGHDLDVFVGSGDLNGYMRVRRCDIPVEIKFMMGVTKKEWDEIITAFTPVITEKEIIESEAEFKKKIEEYKR